MSQHRGPLSQTNTCSLHVAVLPIIECSKASASVLVEIEPSLLNFKKYFYFGFPPPLLFLWQQSYRFLFICWIISFFGIRLFCFFFLISFLFSFFIILWNQAYTLLFVCFFAPFPMLGLGLFSFFRLILINKSKYI